MNVLEATATDVSTAPDQASRVIQTLRTFALLAAYVGVACVLTWPLVANVATHYIQQIAAFDHYHTTWTLAWQTHALVTDPIRFADGNIFHPTPHALYYGPLSLGALPLFAPVFQLSGNPVLAINVTLLGGLALTAWSLHLVVHRWAGSHAAGVAAAAIFLTCHHVLFTFSAPQYAALMYFPWILHFAGEHVLSRTHAALLVVFVTLQSLTDPVYMAPAVLAPLGVLAACRIARRSTRPAGARLAVVLVLAGLAMAPSYATYLGLLRADAALGARSAWAHPVEAYPNLVGVLRFPVNPARITPIMLGLWLLALPVVLLGGTRHLPRGARRGLVMALLWAAVCLPLSLPPKCELHGEIVRMPLWYLQAWLPALERIRVPIRIGLGVLMGFCVLSGLSVAALLAAARARISRRRVTAVVAVALVGAVILVQGRQVWRPLRLHPAPRVAPALLPALRASDGPLLDVSAAGNRLRQARATLLSIEHWRPLLNGYSSYWPPGFLERMEVARRLPDTRALATLVKETGVELLWVDVRPLGPVRRRAWLAADGMRRIAQTEGVWLFQIQPDEVQP